MRLPIFLYTALPMNQVQSGPLNSCIIPVWLPRWLSGKESACQCRRYRFNPWLGKIPWRREWLPTPVSLLGEFHGQRSLADYSPWSGKESDMTEPLNNTNEVLLTAFLLCPHCPPKPWYC